MFILRITLESPLCSGSGLSRPGVADREVVFDDCGLPWLPARRLKGLLREAWSEVRSKLGNALAGLPDSESIFGSGGQELPGNLTLQNGYLPDHEALRQWALAFASSPSQASRRAAIMESYSMVRRQTAMDRETGAPKQETLRTTRTLPAGLIFEAPVECLDTNHFWAVALAAAAVRHMGSSRWRGLGHVRCELLQKGASGAAINWTKEALDGLSGKGFEPKLPKIESEAARIVQPSADNVLPVLTYELTLEEPAVFPVIAGDPNTVNTAKFIPGASIHGWFARAHGDFASDEFRRLFTSGAVRFLNAHPVIAGARAQRIPRSVRRKKDSEKQYIDLTTTTQVKEFRRADGWCHTQKLDDGNLLQPKPETTVHYHHARAQDDRYQRALGPEEARQAAITPEKAGAFFQYQALSPHQRFLGEIHGNATDLTRIRALAPQGKTLELGRSRRAQYGGRAKINWPQRAQAETTQADLTPEGASAEVIEFRLVARSPVLACDENGMPVARFPKEELEHQLNRSLRIKQEFALSSWESGYLSHLRLQRAQQPAWAAGSVLVLQVMDSDRPLNESELARAAKRPYGLRVEQGYGEIDLISQFPPAGILAIDAEDSPIDLKATGPALNLARSLFLQAAQEHARFTAIEIARAVQVPLPAPALLHRLLALLRAQKEEEFRSSVSGLRDQASRQLERCRLTPRRGVIPDKTTRLLELLDVPRRTLAESLTQRTWSRNLWRGIFPARPTVREDLALTFLEELLAILAQESRRKDE